ncbi:MAG: hypothetical protein RIC89_15780 [Pseudomonadales bacterium]
MYIDGYLYYDRHDPDRQPRSDFSLGTGFAGGTAAKQGTTPAVSTAEAVGKVVVTGDQGAVEVTP